MVLDPMHEPPHLGRYVDRLSWQAKAKLREWAAVLVPDEEASDV